MTKGNLHRMLDELPEAAVDAVSLMLDAVVHRRIDPDQAWFWTPEWQAGERETEEDLAAGRVDRFESEEGFIAALEAETAPAAP